MSKEQPYILELDFGMGNIRSLQKAFEYLGANVSVEETAENINKADAVLLPGDGAFGEAMKQLKERKMVEPILDHVSKGKPLLGVCIGFQILFSSSSEFGQHSGLNLVPGKIERFPEIVKPVPHMGWSPVTQNRSSILFKDIPDKSWFYFVHSFRNMDSDKATGVAYYPNAFTAVIEANNIFGTQFHPEKSQKAGLTLLQNFLECV